jgi:hypothetical protein
MQQKYAEDPILRHTYKEGPPGRANGRIKARITEDHHQGPHASQSEEGRAEEAPPRVGRTRRSIEPRWTPVQVHFDMEYPLHFLKAVAKVSIHKDCGNRPWRL